jgi:hypothetical protein
MYVSTRYVKPATNSLPSIIPLVALGPNQLANSQVFALWDLNAVSVDSTAMLAPNGTISAFKLIETATNDFHRASRVSTTCTTGLYYTLSVYVKPVERTWLRLTADSVFDPGNPTAWFNLSGAGSVGTILNAAANVTISVAANGYYRASMAMLALSTGVSRCYVQIVLSDGGDSYNGDGTSGFIPWGAQLNPGGSATGYLAT